MGERRDLHNWLLERAEEAALAGLSLDEALQAVREGYSSIAADQEVQADRDATG